MTKVVMQFYFNSFIGTIKKAECFFNILEEYNLSPDKIGLTEPLKESYSKELAVKLWARGDKGKGRIAGGVMGKKKSPSISFLSEWNQGENYINPNSLTIIIPKIQFKKKQKDFLELFKRINHEFDGLFGYISLEEVENRQFVPGTLLTRLPGIFWCNYFGEIYVDFFGEEKIKNYSWFFQTKVSSRAYLTLLTNNIDELVENEEYELNVKKYLGEESFGNRDEYIRNVDKMQKKLVPMIKLEELFIKID
jgi:hypothetical protein